MVDITEWRPIAVRRIGKLVTDLIETEYSDKEAEEQAGFTARRSCNDNTFALKQLIEKQLSVGKEVHLLVVDLEKAYDNIPSIKLWKALEETTISPTLIKTLKELHTRSVSYVNPLKPELNPICYLLALLGAHHFLHVSRIRVKLLTLR